MCKRMIWAKMQIFETVCVGFRYTFVLSWPCVSRVINVSRKAIESLFSFSIVKLMEFSTALIWLKKSVIMYCFRRTMVSSTYRFQSFGPDIKVFRARVSTSSISMFAITADTGRPCYTTEPPILHYLKQFSLSRGAWYICLYLWTKGNVKLAPIKSL